MLSPIFFKEKPVSALASLAEEDKVWYGSLLAKEIDCTYPHMVNILNEFKKHGLIETEEEGRVKRITLTSDGEDLAIDFQNMLRRMNRIDKKKNNADQGQGETDGS